MTDKVLARIVALRAMPIDKLKQTWRDLYKTEPPVYNRHHLENRLAYRIQEMAYGAVPVGIRRHLVEAGAAHSKIKHRVQASDTDRQQHLMPGTVLIREWDEREHRVVVTPESQCECEGRTFRSLSAVARHITGVQWNGPRFFGLRGEKVGGQ